MPETPSGLHFTQADLRAPWRPGGLPVVFHHGIGTDHAIWSDWLPAVASRHPTLRFDMRGFGASAVPAPGHAWSMAEMTADLWAVIDHAGLAGPVHLVGESIGGTIVLAAAIGAPHRVASVTVSNGSYKGAGIGELPRWRAQLEEGGIETWGRLMMHNRFAPGALGAGEWAWFAARQDRTPPHVALGLGELLARADLTDALPGLPCPLNVVLPDRSPFVPVRHGAEMLELAPNARLRVVPGVRHGLPFSHARTEAEHLVHFLDETERA